MVFLSEGEYQLVDLLARFRQAKTEIGATTREGEGQVKFYPYKTAGGGGGLDLFSSVYKETIVKDYRLRTG